MSQHRALCQKNNHHLPIVSCVGEAVIRVCSHQPGIEDFTECLAMIDSTVQKEMEGTASQPVSMSYGKPRKATSMKNAHAAAYILVLYIFVQLPHTRI